MKRTSELCIVDQIHDLLNAERELLMRGNFVALPALNDRKMALADQLLHKRCDAQDLADVLDKANANQRLMQAASDGTKAAARRVGELSRLETGQGMYERNGRPVAQVSTPRVLRRL